MQARAYLGRDRTPTRLVADPSLWLGPSSSGSRRHRIALDEHERLFDPRRLR